MTDVIWDGEVKGYLFGDTGTHYIHIIPMIFNHRVTITPKHDLSTYDVGWTYPDLASAVVACLDWAVNDWQHEPTGYMKKVV